MAEQPKFSLMATLNVPKAKVVQAIAFNTTTDFYQYAVQYDGNGTSIARSNEPSTYDWEYNSGDNRTIYFSPYIDLKAPLSEHTQTIIEDGGTLITGLYKYSFANLHAILKKADSRQKADFYKNQEDTLSWQKFDDWQKQHDSNHGVQANSNITWSTNFIALPNKPLAGQPVDGQYVSLVGAHELLGDIDVKRTELVATNDGNQCMLAVNDADNNLHLFVYHFNLINALSKKFDSMITNQARFWSYEGFPTDDNVGDDHAKIGDALDFYHALLNEDALFFDLFSCGHDTYTYANAQVLNKVGKTSMSYQGFGLDYLGNIYISSGFAPNGRNSSDPHIYKIENPKSSDEKWVDIPCYNAFVTDNLSLMGHNYFAEIEGIQVLSPDKVLVVVSYHDPVLGEHTVKSQVFRVAW